VKQQIFQKQNKEKLKGINNKLEANSKSKKAGIFVQEIIILRDSAYKIRNNITNNKNGNLLADSQNILIVR
jgi:hypothetical protein